ncbi:MAG TPA: hypothetical protein VHG90_11940 [Acidimicrobiales bacterium]|nr:hypothetical protein [Acidimicrobiales bacterium]
MSLVRTTGPAAAPRRAPAPGRTPQLRVVPDDAAERRRRRLTRACTALAVVMSAAGLFSVVFLQVLLTQGQAELDGLNRRAEVEAAQNRRLRVAVAELESPDRIVGAARQRLGMVPPAAVTYLQAVGPADPLPPVPAGAPPTTATTTATTTAAAPTTTAPGREAATSRSAPTTAAARRPTTAAPAPSSPGRTPTTTATTARTAPRR